MSWRVEHADALSLLRELPDNWAQTCVTSPPCTSAFAGVLAVIAEVRRVLREDGTLWLFQQPGEPLQDALAELGFHRQSSPRWSAPLAVNGRARLLLFTKQSRFFCDALTLDRPRPRGLCCARATQGAARCAQPLPCELQLRLELTRRCMLAGSSPVACGVCGAPYRRARPGERALGARRATCAHNDQSGRCLVLDPFCHPGTSTAEVAHRYGRSFLGITDAVRIGERR